MAFSIVYMGKASSSGNTTALNLWIYNATANGANDTKAETTADGYFNDFQQNLTTGAGPLQVGDVIIAQCSDGLQFLTVDAVTTTVATTALAFP